MLVCGTNECATGFFPGDISPPQTQLDKKIKLTRLRAQLYIQYIKPYYVYLQYKHTLNRTAF